MLWKADWLFTKWQYFIPVQFGKVQTTKKIQLKHLTSYFWKSRKHFGKRGKCWLPAFSPFSTMFSKSFFLRVINLCSKELRNKSSDALFRYQRHSHLSVAFKRRQSRSKIRLTFSAVWSWTTPATEATLAVEGTLMIKWSCMLLK